MRSHIVVALAALIVGALTDDALPEAPNTLASPKSFASIADTDRRSVALFTELGKVLTHPRCVNCHPAGDRPRQGDLGRLHQPPVERGPDGHGLPGAQCATCHGKANPPDSYGAHQPPGVPTDWHLPRPGMTLVFVGRSPQALCEQLKDPARNGNLSLAALLKHVSSDPLVLWGWKPGFGRKPVAVPHAEFVAAFQRWVDAGAPCPAEQTADVSRRTR